MPCKISQSAFILMIRKVTEKPVVTGKKAAETIVLQGTTSNAVSSIPTPYMQNSNPNSARTEAQK